MQEAVVKVLFVCLGNICRSPMAEAVFRHHVHTAGLDHLILSDSAGTHSFNVGSEPDSRAQDIAAERGYDLRGLCARQVRDRDFSEFHYILAMDDRNLAALRRRCPKQYGYKLGLFRRYAKKFPGLEIPDPFFSGAKGFEVVLDLVEDCSAGLLEKLVKEDLLQERHSPFSN